MAELTAYITDQLGAARTLPVILSAEFNHGSGEPCDSAELRFTYENGMDAQLAAATGIRCSMAGSTVFRGVVDEYEISFSPAGAFVDISARGLAAKLMDNESEAREYSCADIGTIIANHVTPCGITDIDYDRIPAVYGYRVGSGQSQWDALRAFTMCSAGISPHFSKSGRLLLKPLSGKTLKMDDSTPILELRWCDRRYGVISEVLVKDASTGASTTVENAPFKARGGMCRRVMNVTTRTDYRPMRFTGEYQIACSESESRVLCAKLPWEFAAEPGDTVLYSTNRSGLSGEYTVTSACCRLDGEGWNTELYMEAK